MAHTVSHLRTLRLTAVDALMFGGGSYRGGAVRIMKSLIAFAEREAQDSQDKAGL